MTEWDTPLDDAEPAARGEAALLWFVCNLICALVWLVCWPIGFLKGLRNGLRAKGNPSREVPDRRENNVHGED